MTARPLILWTLLALAVSLGFLWNANPLPDASDRLDGLPGRGIGFHSRPVEVSDGERSIYGAARVLKRLVALRDGMFVATVIDATRNRHAVHDPLHCFRGAGWQVEEQSPLPLPHGEGRVVALLQDGKTTTAAYWFSNGASAFPSPIRYWFATTLRRITFGKSGPEPVLILLTPVDNNPPDWNSAIEAFPIITEI